VENARALVKTVKESREKMAKLGQVYDENNLVVLEHGRTATGTWGTPIIHVPSGKLVNPNEEMPYDEHTEAVHTRVRPTAYVIPIGTEHEEEILRVVSCHAIPYYVLPEKSRVLLKQYIENDGKTEISEEKAVLFEKGAYVFPNTVPSTVLSMLMESDFGRSSGRKISLFSMGLVEVSEDGKLPIYRYCHNLKDGEIKQI